MQNTVHQTNELDQLLSEDINSAKIRERLMFDQLIEPFHRQVVLFGAGTLGKKSLACLQSDGIEPFAFSDNNPKIWGESVDEVPVFSPEEAAERFGKKAIFIVTIWSNGHSYLDTRRQLQNCGCLNVAPFLPLFWKYSGALLPHFSFDQPHKLLEMSDKIWKAFDLLSDELSRAQYFSHLKQRLISDFEGLPLPSCEDQYFPHGFVTLTEDEVFVDCGAYDGDTIRSFLSRQYNFRRIVTFEPDPFNFEKLSKYISTLDNEIASRITAYPFAVGAHYSKLKFDASGKTGASLQSHGTVEVQCVPLGMAFTKEPPTYLKLDVEGAELEALIGAQDLIHRKMPVVAVCVYHRPNDLWEIPLFLNSLNSEYKFYLRAHDYDGWELVLYAVPPSRLLS